MLQSNKKVFIRIVQVCIVLLVILIAKSSNDLLETKISSDANNRIIDLSTMALKLEEDIRKDIYSAKDTYTGDLTGYHANCPLCSGRLACSPNYYVQDGTDTYIDETYGTVKIVASSKNLPCGTIVRFMYPSISSEPIVAIVLDRGVLGNDLDLLTPTEEYAIKNVGRRAITYDVLRQGWNS